MILNSTCEQSFKESELSQDILCFYINATPYLQMVKLINTTQFKLERVLFPQERLMFTALPDAQLKIKTCQPDIPLETEIIPCDRLQVQEPTSRSSRQLIGS